MRFIFLLFFLLPVFSKPASAQKPDTDFSKDWNIIDSLIIQKNLTRSALEKTHQLYKKAKAIGKTDEMIKALIYQYSLEQKINDDDPGPAISMIQAELNIATSETGKAILQALLAKAYQRYYEAHRWEIYNRKNTNTRIDTAIRSWSPLDFRESITYHYLQSIKHPHVLQKESLHPYSAILIRGNSQAVRPTLYDLLVNEALSYFRSGESYITSPVFSFELTNPNALGGIEDFLASSFTTKDSSSHLWLSLQLFQQLLRFHMQDTDKTALLDANLARIEWVKETGRFPHKKQAYEKALEEITTSYGSHPLSAQAWYLLAREQANQAASFQPFGDTTYRYGYVNANTIATKALQHVQAMNEGVANLKNLIQEINRKEFHSEMERVLIPGKPFRVLISYRNMDTIYQRIIRMPRDIIMDENYWSDITAIKPLRSNNQVLPKVTDLQQHSVEIKIDALPAGYYALLSSTTPDFNPGKDKLGLEIFHVSGISYIRNRNDFFVLDRETGQPLSQVTVKALYRPYYVTSGQNPTQQSGSYVTDENGHFRYRPATNKSYFTWFKFNRGKDTLEIGQDDPVYFDNYENYQNAEKSLDSAEYARKANRVFFFTDRAIYRPGQQVHFKGIAITKDYHTHLSRLIRTKDSSWLYLYGANNKRIDSMRVGINEYGSFNGGFRLPMNGLTGNFHLELPQYNYSRIDFQVEEYKRPQFSVHFEKNDRPYRLNDSIRITGLAQAFAGNPLDGAKVSYTVTRTPVYRYTWYERMPDNYQQRKEIGHGEITADDKGQFTITFKAEATEQTELPDNTIYQFTVQADVTDINGETHSANTSLRAGRQSTWIQIKNPALIDADSLKQIGITTTNLSDQKIPAKVSLSISPLTVPQRLIRKRYWHRPDQFILSEKAFIRDFPNDEYANESNYLSWPAESPILTGTIQTGSTDTFSLQQTPLHPGYYKIEATAIDSFGITVKQVSYMQVFSQSKQLLAMPQYNFTYTITDEIEPGATAHFLAGTAAHTVFVIRTVEKNDPDKAVFSYHKIDSGLQPIDYTAEESDRGGVGISEAYVFQNRVYTRQFSVQVPWRNKTLAVNYETYRTLTEPGSPEKWTVTITGSKGEKAAAELLTGMYDASLDAFAMQNWQVPPVWQLFNPSNRFTASGNFTQSFSTQNPVYEKYLDVPALSYDRLGDQAADFWSDHLKIWESDSTISVFANNDRNKYGIPDRGISAGAKPAIQYSGKVSGMRLAQADMNTVEKKEEIISTDTATLFKDRANVPLQTRKNFSETAFFFPALYADSTGKYSFSFTMPESLTEWKWSSIAHTKDLALGSYSAKIVTQKKLMVQPNVPRFLREGDNMEFSSKIVNLSDHEITGQVVLELMDAGSQTSVDGWFQNVFPTQYFTVDAGKSVAVKFPIEIPYSFNRPLTWRIKAYAGKYTDGEENIIPVLSNRTLITETMPLYLPTDTTVHVSFDKLLHTRSESLTQEALTVEYSSNPVWNAVQALPYLMEYPYECAEQSFNRFYANTLGSFLVTKFPVINKVFALWQQDSTALLSNLQKNESLKEVLLEETPWVLNAASEEEQHKNLSRLFDLVKLSRQSESMLEKLAQLQLPNGSFAWFKGGFEDRYMTNYILTGIGKLKRIGALDDALTTRMRIMVTRALNYADQKIQEDYQWLVKHKEKLEQPQITPIQIDYLYMRSFFRDIAPSNASAYHYYYDQGRKYWSLQNSYNQARLGLVLYRNNEIRYVNVNLIPAILENRVRDTHLGMYWKSTYTRYWYQSPIEHQSMMIAFFAEIKAGFPSKDLQAMQTWLLLNKQTSHWSTTIATADACYALLIDGGNQLTRERKVTIQLGNLTIRSSQEKTTAGTGYFKKRIEGKQVVSEMGNIMVSVKTENPNTSSAHENTLPSWGAVYWQYFEESDKITSAASPLRVQKTIYRETRTDKGKVLVEIKNGDALSIGDKVIVRLQISSDRDMDYLHLKDMRAAATEPLQVISGYQWMNGLGYYQSTRDVSTHFFINHLDKGVHVFDYPLYITHTGIFSTGIATLQCMYAPEFSSHSEGTTIRVVDKSE